MFLEELVAGLTEQGTVSLECKVVGIPSPALRWFRDGDEIRSGELKTKNILKIPISQCYHSVHIAYVMQSATSAGIKSIFYDR